MTMTVGKLRALLELHPDADEIVVDPSGAFGHWSPFRGISDDVSVYEDSRGSFVALNLCTDGRNVGGVWI